MAQIIKLDDQLANQIAAGEVVERPASVVKELVENAIDANSTKIEIEIEDGGLSLIRVRDNGDGIDEDQCELAFHRHATSKIQSERDLLSVRTLGFRGEALASIASVSKTEVKTCTGKGAGTYLHFEAGELKSHSTASSRKGTEITVTKLFFNTPARLKYMKTVHTELGNITDVVYREALARPDIAFTLTHHRKQLLKTSGKGDLLQVIAAVYGMNAAKKMIAFHKESLDFRVSGYLAKPELTRSSRQYISIFINGRYIKNYPILRAIQAGYHTLLPVGRFPIAIVHIEMNPTLVDVNVHPAKLEARLSKEKELTSLITEAIQESFRHKRLIPEPIERAKQERNVSVQPSFSFQFQPKRASSETEIADTPTEPPSPSLSGESSDHRAETVHEETADTYTQSSAQAMSTSVEIDRKRIPPLYPIGQMHGTYLLAQNEKGLYIVDQHAAQERIKYEFYREKVGDVERELQELLVPITFEFSHREALLIEERIDTLRKLGVFLERFGEKTYIVRSHPQWFPRGEEESMIKTIVEKILHSNEIDLKKIREETAIMMACKRSIKANEYLNEDDVHALLDSLRACQDPFTCPHGRPILIHFSTYDIEKMFKRVM